MDTRATDSLANPKDGRDEHGVGIGRQKVVSGSADVSMNEGHVSQCTLDTIPSFMELLERNGTTATRQRISYIKNCYKR